MKTAAVWVSLCVCAMGAERYDVVVYGGTAAGVATAVSAAREGARVVLLEPGKRLGGMMSGGLGETDFGKKEAIGGLAREFFRRVGAHYGTAQYGDDVAWYFEPHVAEAVFREMLGEAKVRVVFGARLKEHGGVVKSGARIVSMAMEDGTAYEARVFADCTYEGDLMAQARVEYTWGREAAAQYGEALGGVGADAVPSIFGGGERVRWGGEVAAGDFAGWAGRGGRGRPEGAGLQFPGCA